MSPEEGLAGAGLVFARVSALTATLPIFTADGMPRAAGVGVAVGVTWLVAPAVGPFPATASALMPALAGELLAGWLLGLGIMGTFQAISVMAEVVAGQSGLNLGSMADPVQTEMSSPLGIMASMAAASAFVGVGLHRTAIELVARSFDVVRPGGWVASPELAIHALASCLSLGLQLAGPLLALVWALQWSVALLGRMAPRMNVFFSVGNTAIVAAALAMLGLSLPWMIDVHLGALAEAVHRLAGP